MGGISAGMTGPVVYSDEELLRTLKRLAQGGATLSRREFEPRRQDSDPSAPLYERRFGRWNRALECAGLDTVEQPEHLRRATKKWTRAQLVAAVRQCLTETGSTTVAAYETWRAGPANQGVDLPPATTIRYRMGSWSRVTALACASETA
ncbi:homing endonuclease associated repeat-containing protein [Streptomyces sp. MMS24-I29]|uniref:homing endonuclease associated repeat-containing protein n=1 Tax=Streptomyces sp. MMS24-I29 TaxID=3351480 RepID=UPI003C7A283F